MHVKDILEQPRITCVHEYLNESQMNQAWGEWKVTQPSVD